MTVDERIKQVDDVLPRAAVSLARYSCTDLELAQQLCEHFELKLGMLIRRAEAIRLLADTESDKQRLQEAAQHLVILNQ